MSDKVNGFTVVFEKSVSEEYMDMVKQAISLYKGVISIESHIEDAGSYIASMQESSRIRNAIFDILKKH